MRRGVTHFVAVTCDRCGAHGEPVEETAFGHSLPAGWISFDLERCGFDMCLHCKVQPVTVVELLDRARAPHAGWPMSRK